jgi:hypothetical protein
MKKIFGLLMISIIAIMLMSCTENQRAKSWGGTADVNVEPNHKVVNVTWKDNDLWILVRPMTSTDVPETLVFYEKSGWGVLNGKYVIHEQKSQK